MSYDAVRDKTSLVVALLDILPKVLQRIAADVPFENEESATNPELHDITELRATPGQISLLKVLVEHQRCTMQELAGHLAVTPSTVTAMIKRLLAQGYVERSRGDNDWRTVWVKATERGNQVVATFDQARQASLQARLEQLSEQEQERLRAAIPVLYRLIEIPTSSE